MKTINDFILFESDQEFVDFCLAPYGVVVYPENGTPPYYTGVYSENYKNAIIEGKTFIIKDKNSVVYKHMCVAKRVPIQGTGRIALVEKYVQNLKPYFDD